MTETAGNELRAAKEASGKSYSQIAQEIGMSSQSTLIHKIIEKGEYASLAYSLKSRRARKNRLLFFI